MAFLSIQAHFQHILQFRDDIKDAQVLNHPDPEQVQDQVQPEPALQQIPPQAPTIPRGRGRPPGSKNKPKPKMAAPIRDRSLKRTTQQVDNLSQDEAVGIVDSINADSNDNSRPSSPESE